jgi:Flp pilus assembly pilin Flp
MIERMHAMIISRLAARFRANEDGAVTVDWVVLTAAIVGLGVAVMSTVKTGSNDLADKISEGLGSIAVTTE